MELKFKVRNFSKTKKELEKLNARFVDRRKEHYIYLKQGGKLQRRKGNFYFVSIKKKKNMFILDYRKITKREYDKIKRNSEIKRILTNKRQIYKIDRTEISFNELEVGRFVILDGNEKDTSALAKKFGLNNLITKPFSEL